MADEQYDVPERTPSQETLEALREQWTPQLRKELILYATQRARMVRHSGRPCPPPAEYARELLHDVHTATWIGDLVWRPQDCPLEVHVRAAIKRLTGREIERAVRFVPLESEDSDPDDDVGGSAAHATLSDARHRFSSSPNAAPPAVLFPALIRRMCEALRVEAHGEPDCLGILDAWESGVLEPDEIMRNTGLEAAAYHRARKRLLYAGARLSPELRHAVQHYLRRAT